MATLDDSVGTATANSYVDVAYADDYWAKHYSSIKADQWAALSDDQKARVLLAACSVLEGLRFTVNELWDQYAVMYDSRRQQVYELYDPTAPPVKFYYFQRLQFPRNLDVDPDSGAEFVPEDVKAAQCEQAMYLLNLDETVLSNRLQGVKSDSVGVGSGQVQLAQQYGSAGSAIAPMAVEFLSQYLVRNAKMRRA